jgi:hypothetical protein
MKFLVLALLFLIFLSCAVDKPAKSSYEDIAKPSNEDISTQCQNEYCKELYDSLAPSANPYYGIYGYGNNQKITYRGDLLQLFPIHKEKARKYVDNCECWVGRQNYREKPLFIYYKEAFEEELKKKQEEEKSTNEINALIENEGIEISVILDKCNEHQKAFKRTVQTCDSIKYQQGSILYQQAMPKLAALLKENKLEMLIEECKINASKLSRVMLEDSLAEKYNDLCSNQLVAKIRKLPKNKINTIALAKIYYTDYEHIPAKIINNYGNEIFAEKIGYDTYITVKTSGHIGECNFKSSDYFNGYMKYIGQSPSGYRTYQLLWCEDWN